jgi:hypothetical protein
VWYLNDDDATPRLPSAIQPKHSKGSGKARQAIQTPAGPPSGPPAGTTAAPFAGRPPAGSPASPLDHGCWLVQIVPFFSDDYDPRISENPQTGTFPGWTLLYQGPLRVQQGRNDDRDTECTAGRLRASGDLYVKRQEWWQQGAKTPPPLPYYDDQIPVFLRRDYSFYYTVQEIESWEGGEVRVELATFHFDAKNVAWEPVQDLTAVLAPPNLWEIPEAWRQAAPRHYLSGTVVNADKTPVATIEMGWISSFLREGQLRTMVAPGLRVPLENGLGDSVDSVLGQLGWRIRISDSVEASVRTTVWESKDLHAGMLALRTGTDLDQQWSYHALVVPRFYKQEDVGFGRTYDQGLDTDLVPREGLVVAESAKFPAVFGPIAGKMVSEVPEAAFFVFMHELGHTMGLLHRFRGRGYMNEVTAFAGTTQSPFPGNLSFTYDPKDELRLRHHPDIWVRPGGTPLGAGSSAAPVPDGDLVTDVSTDLELAATPLVPVVPLGAPVRLQLRLTNRATESRPAPAQFSLSAGTVSGNVIAPGGEVHMFAAAAPFDDLVSIDLAPDQSLYQGETLWRGTDGALFPAPGIYRIEVNVEWVAPGGIATTTAQCEVLVSTPRSSDHENVALGLLASKDVVVFLVFGTSPDSGSRKDRQRLTEARELLHRASSVAELRASIAPIEANLLAQGDLGQAARLIDSDSLLTTNEIDNLLKAVKNAGPSIAASEAVRSLVTVCRSKAVAARCAGLIDQAELERLLGLNGIS